MICLEDENFTAAGCKIPENYYNSVNYHQTMSYKLWSKANCQAHFDLLVMKNQIDIQVHGLPDK